MWAGPPQWTQWALNPSAYQDMSNDEGDVYVNVSVDWARLAQQWIMMKETSGPPEQQPVPPPPPVLDKPLGEEGGEAPMDIGKDEDADSEPGVTQSHAAPPGWNSSTPGWSSSANWQQWGGYGPWPGQQSGAVSSTLAKNGSDSTTATPYGYPSTAPGYFNNATGRGNNFAAAGGFWPDGSILPHGGPGQQMPFVRQPGAGRGARWEMKKNRGPQDLPVEEEEDGDPIIDAAKRRKLPVWIREGLEKMEREKQKQAEREKQEHEREQAMRQRRLQEQQALSEIQAERGGLPPKSKFDSDSEEASDVEALPAAPSPPTISEPPKRKSRFHDGPPVEVLKLKMQPPSPPTLTKEELVMKVRRTMTEVLLDVTTDEILLVVREALSRARRKAPAKQPVVKNTTALASLKANLGLAMYGSGSDGDSSGDEDEGQGHSDSEDDSANNSDSELRDEIRRRKQDFVVQEREIEAQAAQVEERERMGGRGPSEGKGEAEGSTDVSTVKASQERQVENESVDRASFSNDGVIEERNGIIKEDVIVKEKEIDKDDKNHKSKSEKKKRSKSSSSTSSRDSSSSSRSSKRKHKKKHKERRKNKHRSKERERKRRDRSESRSPQHDKEKREKRLRKSRSYSPRNDRKRSRSPRRHRSRSLSKQRDHSESRSHRRSPDRRHRRRSHSSESDHYRRRRRSRSRSDSKRRHRKHRSSSRSSYESERRHKKSSRR